MLDESFHLTPVDVRRYDFGSALRGYDKARVEQFREQVAAELERLARVAQDFESKAKGFHEQLRAFRERDKALNDALVSAQQLGGQIREQAEREGQLIIRDAQGQADRVVDAARAEMARMHAELDALERTRRSHLAQLRAMAQRQLAEIEAAEHAGRDASVAAQAVEPLPAPGVVRTTRPLHAAPRQSQSIPVPTDAPPPRVSQSVAAPVVPSAEPARPLQARPPDTEPTAPEGEPTVRTPTWLDSSVPE